MMQQIFYACFKFKDGYVVKIPYTSREEAREHIRNYFDFEKHEQCWTE